MTLDEKIQLVKQDLLSRHPEMPHTVRILLWDDGTDMVSCQYGDGKQLYISTYYKDELTYSVDVFLSEAVQLLPDGRTAYVLTPEQMEEYYSA
jgi:hypothetical protein